MNEYKITYTGESEGYRIITDRTEAAAKKFFREDAKELGLGRISIESVELVNTNALASKRNERETLEVIRQLVADLGPQSYLATAFEGCFQDAEDNIDDDAAYSMKARWESAEEKVKKLEAELKKAKEDLERLTKKAELDYRDLRLAIEKVKEEDSKIITSLREQILSPDDLCDLRQILEDLVEESEEKAREAAQEIVKYAEAPTGKEFTQAVADHRNHTKYAEYHRELLGRVVAAEAAAHAGA